MNRRQFLQVSLTAATLLLLRNYTRDTEGTAAAPSVPAPPTPPTGGLMTIPFFVGRPRDKQVYMPVISRE